LKSFEQVFKEIWTLFKKLDVKGLMFGVEVLLEVIIK
jgi:hypothetical protein